MNCINCVFHVAGLFAAFAYEDISYQKVATQSHTSTSVNSDARNAVDGNIKTCMKTEDIGLTSKHRTVWWKVDLGEVNNIYSIHIQFKNYDGDLVRQRGRFAGFSLYVSDTDVSSISEIKSSTLCYKDGPQLPPLNFTTICTEKGRYVIYYNERLDRVIYPAIYQKQNVYSELCKVIVQGCKNASVYGSNCDTPCPTNCKDSTCHIQSGTCFTCKPGWTGTYCNTQCGKGWFGLNCSQHCVGHCKYNMSCNHATGQCDEGCAAGWTGTTCDKGRFCHFT
ncbi:multiple epidermal growth factor-like domains protein 10 [Crassostrea angulata]|uniref:multiple epidermal growth factor-like domains protein 10 n=1 Tax=Magallana angulata TaxID=2784310 RepID=UPI0022B11EE6|nr:multiple epidermal growth factor-like domains protein 10 [Crassostrea angulata]